MVAPTKRLDVDGVTTGELLTTSNTDLDQVIPAGTGSATAETTAVLRGAKGVHVTGASGDTYTLVYTDTAAASASVQTYFRSAGNPTANNEFVRIRSGSGNMGRIIETTTGTLILQNAAGSTIAWSGGTFTRTANTIYRCQIQVTKGTTTSDGTLSGQIYDDSDTLVRSVTSSANTNTGTADATTGQCGKVITGSAGVDMDVDEFAFITGTTAEIDAVPANTAPSAGPDQSVDAYTLVTLSGTDLESGVTWTQTGGSPTVTLGGSGNVRTFTAPAIRAGTTLTFQVSDGTLTDSMTVTVFPHNEYAVMGGVEVPIQMIQA
jgi:hypothetical protein